MSRRARRILALVLLFCASSLLTPLASAVPLITVPTGLSPGDQYRLAFVTTTVHDALSSDTGSTMRS